MASQYAFLCIPLTSNVVSLSAVCTSVEEGVRHGCKSWNSIDLVLQLKTLRYRFQNIPRTLGKLNKTNSSTDSLPLGLSILVILWDVVSFSILKTGTIII